MAQTKTRKPKSSKPKPATKSKAKRPKSVAAKAKAKAKPSASAPSGSNGSRSQKSRNGHSPSKVALPLVAGGAALAGTVGGVLIGASRSGDKVLGVPLPHPKRIQVKFRSSDLAKAAKQVGRFGENVGELTAELKRTRQGLAGDNKHSSPIEVLLRGLTARR